MSFTHLTTSTANLIVRAQSHLSIRQTQNNIATSRAEYHYGVPWIPSSLKASLTREHDKIVAAWNRIDKLRSDYQALNEEAIRRRRRGGSPMDAIRRPPSLGYVGLGLIEGMLRVERKVSEVMSGL